MTDIFIARRIADALEIDTPADWTGTVNYIQGHVLAINSPDGSWDDNNWRGGAVVVNNGRGKHLRAVVIASHADQLILATPFPPDLAPQTGDSIKLTGGPLSVAVLYEEDPSTLEADWKAGRRYFVTIDVVAGTLELSGMGGRSNEGVEAATREFNVEVMCFTKNITGKSTETDLARVFYDLPLLKEQVMSLIYAWRLDAANGLKGTGEIAWGRTLLQISGTEPLRGYVLEFDVSAGRGN